MNEYGQEIYPLPNPKVIAHLSERATLVYSIGSLYTSIVPCLILRGVGNAIAHSPTLRHKVLILNGTPDRETEEYTAMDFITSITSALNESQLIDARHDFYDAQMADAPTPPSCQQHIQQPTAYDPMTRLRSDPSDERLLGLSTSPGFHTPPFPPNLIPNSPPSAFITHLIYLENSGNTSPLPPSLLY
jgi:hypothetical protein